MAEFEHGPRPAVRHDEWKRPGLRRADMQEMDAKPVKRRSVRTQAVQQLFAPSPVIAVLPPIDERTQVGEWRPLTRVIDRLCVGPASPLKTAAKFDEVRFGYI